MAQIEMNSVIRASTESGQCVCIEWNDNSIPLTRDELDQIIAMMDRAANEKAISR